MKLKLFVMVIVTLLAISLLPNIVLAADNQAPQIVSPASFSIYEDTPTALTGISFSDADALNNEVMVTLQVNSGTIFATTGSGVTAGGSGTQTVILNGSVSNINAFVAASGVTFTPLLHSTSNVTLEISINDNGHTGEGGALTSSDSVVLTVIAINDPPVNVVPVAQRVNRNGSLVFSAANGNQILITDVDAGDGVVRAYLDATDGIITLGGITGLSFIVGDGTSDSTMEFEGTIVDINSAMNGMRYNPNTGFEGSAMLSIESNDFGFSGSGGPQTDTDTVSISVLPIYDNDDFLKVQAFLDQPSSVAGKTNGQMINIAYNPNNPATWTGVVWSSSEPYRVLSIGASGTWYNKSLSGPLDLSGLSQLNYLLVTQNNLTSLDLSYAGALETVFCFGNRLTSITLSANNSLENIYCQYNNLTSLDLSGAPSLIGIQCGGNILTDINTTSNAELQNLYCSVNLLEYLDVSHNPELTALYCEQNRLTQLNVLYNPELREISFGYNQLSSINLSANPLLEVLMCNDNALTVVDLNSNTELSQLVCYRNRLDSLDLSNNTELTRLDCSNNLISSLNLSVNPYIMEINCSANQLTILDLSGLTLLEVLNCSDNRLMSIQTSYDGNDISVFAIGDGYVELRLSYLMIGDAPLVTAVSDSSTPLICWTESGYKVSDSVSFSLVTGRDYSLTANYSLSLSSSVPGGAIFVGESITLTPNIMGGTWGWSDEYYTASFNSPATFTALKLGASTISYTVEGVEVFYDISAIQAATPTPTVSPTPNPTTTPTPTPTVSPTPDPTTTPTIAPTLPPAVSTDGGTQAVVKTGETQDRIPMVFAFVISSTAMVIGATYMVLRFKRRRKVGS